MTVPSEEHNLFVVPERPSFRDAVVAIIVVDDGRYLMQLRDDKPGIFYPDHWGLFGGAVEAGEEPEVALRRELVEELGLVAQELRYFTRMDFEFAALGASNCYRMFFEVPLRCADLSALRLGEGRLMKPLALADVLLKKRVVPYDSFAVWMHYAWRSQDQVVPHQSLFRVRP
jgi:8-oxo-dGTP pyrophosphatase MutT (NUDIX family)